jgi:hypothetical protein
LRWRRQSGDRVRKAIAQGRGSTGVRAGLARRARGLQRTAMLSAAEAHSAGVHPSPIT